MKQSGLLFSDRQAITSTVLATNWFKLGDVLPFDLTDIPIVVNVDTAFTTSNSATLGVEILTSANDDFSSPLVIDITKQYTAAELVAGFIPISVVGQPNWPLRKYIGLRFVVPTGVFTAGNATASLGEYYTKQSFSSVE
jgi:hypothetical protein